MKLARLSIRGRLLATSLFSSSAALLMACIAFLSYELLTYRGLIIQELLADARILAYNATSPLLFDDAEAARVTLAALRSDPRIISATVTKADGTDFATFGQAAPAEAPRGLEPAIAEHRFEGTNLILSLPIMSDRTRIGTITLRSNLRDHWLRIRRYLYLTGGILGVSLVSAFVIASYLQRRISQPVMRLTEAARVISSRGDYSIRSGVGGDDEVGLLGRTFDQMLERIEKQNVELQRSVQMRDEFLSIASHELKTPLTPLQLQIQAVQRLAHREGPAFSPEKLSGKIDQINRQVGRLEKLINSLLDISRITSRRLQMEYEEVDLSELVREVSERFSEDLRRQGCELRLAAASSLVGSWDRLRLEQIFSNLLSNAIKFGAGKPIDVAVRSAGDMAELEVRDHGIGIELGDQGRIFERFERAVPSQHYGGFGLGLWIVRQIVDTLGGTIRVESELRVGSRFVVNLPLRPSRGEAAAGAGDAERLH